MIPIIEHADVQRMLMTMKANVHAARGVCHLTGVSLDLASHADTEAERTAAANRAALLTPIAKAFSTDIGDEATSIGVQVHGGMGFIEETGAAQHMRDSRIAAIYEGANGIHGVDLVHRKLPLAGGETVRNEIAGIRQMASDVAAKGGAGFGATAERLAEAADALEESTRLTLDWLGDRPERRRSRARRNICACSGLRSAARVWPKQGLRLRRWRRNGTTKANSDASASPASSPKSWRRPRPDSRAPSPRGPCRLKPMRRSWRRAHNPWTSKSPARARFCRRPSRGRRRRTRSPARCTKR